MWQSIVKVIGLVFLDLGMLCCLILIPLGVPGNCMLLALTILAAWLGGFQALSWLALSIMATLIILAEVVEALLGSAMAKRYGASWWGVGGAFVGGIAGVIIGSALLPVVGTLFGAFLGAAAGAVLLEGWHLRRIDNEALRAGWGALLGRLMAALFKVSVGVGIAVYVVIRTH